MLGRIAVHLNDDKACDRRIDAALMLAKEHKAQVMGVYPLGDAMRQSFYQNIIPQDIQESVSSRHDRDREAICKRFLEKAKAAGVEAQWRAPAGDIEEVLALHARYNDLMVLSKSDHIDPVTSIIPHLPESVVMAAGRPVLMIPNVGRIETIGHNILYCWDQKREAARAFTDAAPFLGSCKALSVLEVDRNDDMLGNADIRDDDLSQYCTSRGYPKPRLLYRKSEDIGVGNIILNTATDTGCDLIVMGAYGHSRMRQWVMGGASRTLLSTMTVPVLLSH
ncbi:MAG: universal stress protein [Castellaniella sp.]